MPIDQKKTESEPQLTTKNAVRAELDRILRMTSPPSLLATVMRDILDEMQAEGGEI